MQFEIVDRGLIDYATAWKEQQMYFDAILQGERTQGVVMLCEHPHVYTLGRSGEQNNLLVNDEFLAKIGASYYKTDRGGDITYHGPGQLVAYPILNLGGMGLKEYIGLLEQSVIDTVADWGIRAERMNGATGVWIEGQRKICAIGVRASKFVTMHGFALNVHTDLNYFNFINPCGFVDKGVTSMASELGGGLDGELGRGVSSELGGGLDGELDMTEVKRRFAEHFGRLFNRPKNQE